MLRAGFRFRRKGPSKASRAVGCSLRCSGPLINCKHSLFTDASGGSSPYYTIKIEGRWMCSCRWCCGWLERASGNGGGRSICTRGVCADACLPSNSLKERINTGGTSCAKGFVAAARPQVWALTNRFVFLFRNTLCRKPFALHLRLRLLVRLSVEIDRALTKCCSCHRVSPPSIANTYAAAHFAAGPIFRRKDEVRELASFLAKRVEAIGIYLRRGISLRYSSCAFMYY